MTTRVNGTRDPSIRVTTRDTGVHRGEPFFLETFVVTPAMGEKASADSCHIYYIYKCFNLCLRRSRRAKPRTLRWLDAWLQLKG